MHNNILKFTEMTLSLNFFDKGELFTVACSPTDATLVATGGGDDRGFLWKVGQGDWAFDLQGMHGTFKAVDSKQFIECLCCYSLHISFSSFIRWSSVAALYLSAGHTDSVSCLAFSADGQLLASGSFDGLVKVWKVPSGNLMCTLDGPGAGIEVILVYFFV